MFCVVVWDGAKTQVLASNGRGTVSVVPDLSGARLLDVSDFNAWLGRAQLHDRSLRILKFAMPTPVYQRRNNYYYSLGLLKLLIYSSKTRFYLK